MQIGYVRLTPNEHSEAVQWWYFWEYEDGWAFARGGRCRTTREARRLLRNLHGVREQERREFLNRPQVIIEADGSLTRPQYSPYDAVPQEVV